MAAMATLKSSTLTYLIHHLLRHPKPTSPLCLFLRPFPLSVLTRKSNHHDEVRFPSISSSLPLPRFYMSLSHSFSPLLVPKSFSSVAESEQDEDNVSVASFSENNDGEEDGSVRTTFPTMTESSALKLSVKEKRKLASYAHILGKQTEISTRRQVGRYGFTCPLLLRDAGDERALKGQIARTVILYRPSRTKLKAEETKEKR